MVLARQHDHVALLAIDAEPETAELLALLPEEFTEATRVHLEGARSWRRRKVEANKRRLGEVRQALDGFDLVRARSILLRIEEEYLSPESVADRDQILLDFESRSMETEQIQAIADEIIQENTPRWRRWIRRRD